MSGSENPYQPPRNTSDFWQFDRSGIGRRLVEILAISGSCAFLGQTIGNVFLPNLRVGGGGGNLLMVIVPVTGLAIWFVVKAITMWKQKEIIDRHSKQRSDPE